MIYWLKDTSKHRILYGENNDLDENQEHILNRFENEIKRKFLREDWEADFQQEIKRKRMENVMKLTMLEICDICSLKAYICSFEEINYKWEFDSDENIVEYYNDLHFIKVIDPWGKRVM